MYVRTRSSCACELSGPSFVVSASGSPTVKLFATSAASFAASWYFDAGTSMRVSAVQVWPELR